MCRSPSLAIALALVAGPAVAAPPYPGIGRGATPAEIASWDIDVRPDFKGLPRGQGSVAQGQALWEAKCASCHGVFGESTETFNPLVGGTTADDLQTGRTARLNDPAFPGRSTLMKVATVSTLWDYIRRAMPWNQPKSLTPDEVYAATAYLLNLGRIVPDDFVLSDTNIASVQARLPNRLGTTTDHGLWPGKGFGNGGKPDVNATACMHDCAAAPVITSSLPAYARHQHGNLAEQQRLVGPLRGVDTQHAGVAAPVSPPTSVASSPPALLQQHSCTACHGVDRKIVGPAFRDIARKYAAQAEREAYLLHKIQAGGQGIWGTIPMPPQAIPEADASAIAAWLASGAK